MSSITGYMVQFDVDVPNATSVTDAAREAESLIREPSEIPTIVAVHTYYSDGTSIVEDVDLRVIFGDRY